MAVVTPPSVNQFRVMNYGQAAQAGQQIKYNRIRNEAAGMELEEAQDMLRNRKRAEEIRAQFDKMPDQIKALEDAKLFKEADALRDTYIKSRKAEVELIEAMRLGITKDNYQDVRQQMIQSGAITPELWPVEYSDKWFQKERDTKAAALTRFTRKSWRDGAIMSQDIMQRGGAIEWQGEWYKDPDDLPDQGGSDGADWKGMDASDSNTIYGETAGLWGGVWDPTTGRITGLEREAQQKVAGVAAEAARIFNDNKGQIPHSVAVNQAARKLGVQIPDLSKTPGVEDRDPLGIRKNVTKKP